MGKVIETASAAKQSTLQKILTSAVNELGMEAIVVAIMRYKDGSFSPQVTKGFTAREVRAILRALCGESRTGQSVEAIWDGAEPRESVQLRMITPSPRVLLVIPLRNGPLVYGALILGRKEHTTLSKRDKAAIEEASTQITEQLKQAKLFDMTVVLGHALVAKEPILSSTQADGESRTLPRSYATPEIEEKIAALWEAIQEMIAFDRAWVTIYDPVAASLEVLGSIGGTKKDLAPGQRLGLDTSASGWAVRHRKLRVDQDLASTQGRFQDHKQLYKDRFRSTMVAPFLVRGRVAGTVSLASKTPKQYDMSEFAYTKLEWLTTKFVELFEDPSFKPAVVSESESLGTRPIAQSPGGGPSEPAIRREERQAALNEFSSFLATEVREPMGSIRAQLEEVTSEGQLEFESQTRVESAMRDLMRVEALLHEILDFTKPLELNRRPCRVPDVLEKALALISTDLQANRIEVTKQYARNLGPVRWDEARMQQVFLSIFQNGLEAMSLGGHLGITVSLQRGRQTEVRIIIQNDGVPIPPEHVDKVFEPYFTTKRSGTGFGLAAVKRIIEEHRGRIAIASGPDRGTTVTIKLPASHRRAPYVRRGQPHKPRRVAG